MSASTHRCDSAEHAAGAPTSHAGVRFLLRHGRVPPSRLPRLILFAAKNTLSFAESAAERWIVGERIRATVLAADPVFVLGHYRSGTTLLHKLLAADPQFGTVCTFDLLFPFLPVGAQRVARPLLQRLVDTFGVRQGFFHADLLRLDDPNETEALMLSCGSPTSVYWGYVLPSGAPRLLARYVDFHEPSIQRQWMDVYAYFLRRTARRVGGRRLVVKDPPNMARIPALLGLCPNAKFVCVRRDPRWVFLSMRALWRDVIERRFSLQTLGAEERDAIVLTHYRTLMEAYLRDRASIPRGALAEVRYEDLLPDPVQRMREIYGALGLAGFDRAVVPMTARVELERTHRGADYDSKPDIPRVVERELATWRGRLGYSGRSDRD
jgi:hypothetical protein